MCDCNGFNDMNFDEICIPFYQQYLLVECWIFRYISVYCIAEIELIKLVIGVSLLGMVEWTVMCSRDGNWIGYKNLNNLWIWQHNRAIKYNNKLGSNWTKNYSSCIVTQLGCSTKMCTYPVSIHTHMPMYCHVTVPIQKSKITIKI